MLLQRTSRLAGLVSAMMLLCGALSAQDTAAVSPVAPVQAALIAPLDVTHVHPGSVVFARVEMPWSRAGCVLAPGSMVVGHVASARKYDKAEKVSSLELVFDKADCKGDREGSTRFSLMALIGVPEGGLDGGTKLDSGLPLAVSRGAGRSISDGMGVARQFTPAARNLPSQVMPGDVFAISKTHLQITPDQSVTKIVASRDVRLETGTILILLPREVTKGAPAEAKGEAKTEQGHVAEASAHPPATVAPVALPEPPDVTDVCLGACTALAKGTEDATVKAGATSTVSLDSYGLLPASNRELARLNEDTNVVYLDATHLLCTFDPRHLRERTEIEGEPARLIRAVVVSTKDFKVERVLDWRVRGAGQYLWQLASGRLLVHLGRDLKELDSSLKPVASFPLEGRLAWVVSSPSGDHLAIGTVVERYSAAVRRQMQQALSEMPEEELKVSVYDGEHHALVDATRSSRLAPPVLSDAGELRMQRDGQNRWKITEMDWQQKERLLATTRTTCRPVLSAPYPGLIFMLGCNAVGDVWYRMLHEDGHPVLKAESSATEFGQSARASMHGAFAVRLIETDHALDRAQPFRPSELLQERISVYSGATGARLSSVATSDFAPTEQGYALSPDGAQLAVIGRSALFVYPLHP